MVEPAFFGSKPVDGGNLMVDPEDYAQVAADPVAAKYLHPVCGSKEIVRGLQRWCLWMAGDDFDPADITRSPILKQRITACRNYRESAPHGGDAYKYRDTPYLFRPNKHRPTTDYLCIPSVVSETRRYFTAARLDADTITTNAAFTVVDADGLQFALISSSMFITWQRAVGGRLKSDLRFANTVTWNTFPVPDMDEKTRTKIITAGRGVLEARALHPERCLADHYNPLAMDPNLIKAHNQLDQVVDKAFGAPRRLVGDKQRLEILFRKYTDLTRTM